MKRNLILIILMTFLLSTYAEDFLVLEGEWERQSFYDYMTSNPQSSTDRQKRRYQPPIAIRIGSDGTGSYQEAGIIGFGINRIETQGNNEFTLYLEGYVENWDMGTGKIDIVGEVYITIIDEDSIFVTNEEGFMHSGPSYDEPWYRVSGPAKIPVQYGLINDTRVRLRTKPNLECDTWGFLNTGDEVTIIDKSADMQKIGDMEDYWYKVQTNYFPDGWVYGTFIDFFELDSFTKPLRYGVVNNFQVELKNKLGLDGEPVGYLNIFEQVDIIGQTAKKQKIGDMEDYWYKVRIDGFPNSWIYGAFIDIKDY